MSGYIRLNNGEKHYFMQPFKADIKSIGESLAHVNRFTGHVGTYSVAQHCVLVAEQLPDHLKLAGLLHDAPEAYLNDVSKPLKELLPDYQKIERWYHQEIDGQFKVSTEHPAIKEADLRMLITEGNHFGLPRDDFPEGFEPYDIKIRPWSPDEAFFRFMSAFYAYRADSFSVEHVEMERRLYIRDAEFNKAYEQ